MLSPTSNICHRVYQICVQQGLVHVVVSQPTIHVGTEYGQSPWPEMSATKIRSDGFWRMGLFLIFFIRSLHISAVSKVSCAKEDYQTRDLSVNRANNAHIATFLLFPFVPSKPNIERILDVPIRSYVHHDEFAAITHLLVSYFIASGISERLVRNVFGIPEHQIIEYATKQFK